jgi:hypothetical protein
MRLELSERFTVLKTAARSNSKYMAWYLSDINGREPDFILFCRDTVLSIFEVKDWSLDQIIRIEMPNRCPGGQHLQEQQSRHAGSQANPSVNMDIPKQPRHHRLCTATGAGLVQWDTTK